MKGMPLVAVSNAYEREAMAAARESGIASAAPLRFYAELFVGHSPAEVWALFCDLANWRRWSPICSGCRLIDNGPLQIDSILEIRFKLAGITNTVPARIVQFDPPELITWQGQKFGIQATHRYRFIPRNEGTLLCNEEIFTGVGFPLNRLMSAWYRSSKLSSESLKGIKRELAPTSPGTTERVREVW